MSVNANRERFRKGQRAAEMRALEVEAEAKFEGYPMFYDCIIDDSDEDLFSDTDSETIARINKLLNRAEKRRG